MSAADVPSDDVAAFPVNPNVVRPAQRSHHSSVRVLILSSVMLTFIGVGSTAAVVVCDLVSTVYYIGGVVESQIGKAAPWFILAVMVFSYGVRNVYIESCTMFVRGGVYRIVKEAMGRGMAKVAVSALMFDYILTGPIGSVSAGHYLVRLFNSLLKYLRVPGTIPERLGAAGVAIAVVLYFYQANLRGIGSSSSKAIKIMWATNTMAAVMIVWCVATLMMRPETRSLPPLRPELGKKVDGEGKPIVNEITKKQVDPLGWIAATPVGDDLRPDRIHWMSAIGVLGIVIAFGHSILAMSGEETLAQVYREVRAPKLSNFKKVAFIVFISSLGITALLSFFAVMIIPDNVRANFQENLISGLAMNVVGPHWARLAMNTVVVIVGFLILAGSVNTSIVGANSVLNRLADDGVLPAWFQRPQKTLGTTWRLLTLIAGLQVGTIVITCGDVILLGEAYAFGVVWSLTLMCLSMLILRFTEPDREREYRVPLNMRIGRRELPIGLVVIALVLTAAALANFLTKTVATVSGLAFAAALLAVFAATEWFHNRRNGKNGGATEYKHLEQFKLKSADELSPQALGLDRPYRKLVYLSLPDHIEALEACLVETDSEKTDIVVATAHPARPVEPDADSEQDDIVEQDGPSSSLPPPALDIDDRKLMTAVVNRSERAGKPVKPIVLFCDDPAAAVVQAAHDLAACELILSPVGAETPAVELERIVAQLQEHSRGRSGPMTVRIIGKDINVSSSIAGGSQAPCAAADDGETARAVTKTGTD